MSTTQRTESTCSPERIADGIASQRTTARAESLGIDVSEMTPQEAMHAVWLAEARSKIGAARARGISAGTIVQFMGSTESERYSVEQLGANAGEPFGGEISTGCVMLIRLLPRGPSYWMDPDYYVPAHVPEGAGAELIKETAANRVPVAEGSAAPVIAAIMSKPKKPKVRASEPDAARPPGAPRALPLSTERVRVAVETLALVGRTAAETAADAKATDRALELDRRARMIWPKGLELYPVTIAGAKDPVGVFSRLLHWCHRDPEYDYSSWPFALDVTCEELVSLAHAGGAIVDEPGYMDLFVSWSREERRFTAAGLVADGASYDLQRLPTRPGTPQRCRTYEAEPAPRVECDGLVTEWRIVERERTLNTTTGDRIVRWMRLDQRAVRKDPALAPDWVVQPMRALPLPVRAA